MGLTGRDNRSGTGIRSFLKCNTEVDSGRLSFEHAGQVNSDCSVSIV